MPGAGRSEALKRFVVEEGVGKAPRFLEARAVALGPAPGGSEEKRWIDGVLGRK